MANLDLACACALVAGTVCAFGATSATPHDPNAPERVTALPARLCRAGLRALQPLVRAAAAAGVSANMITAFSLAAGAGAGLLLACGHFGIAAVLFVAASCGDALDGLVARATRTQCLRGAVFDASVDRYEEFFAFGGLALYFRSSGLVLALTVLALAGASMVSYGSALAEANHVAVPAGLMRRPERAALLGVGIVLGPIAETVSPSADGFAWVRDLPIILAVVVIAVVGNASAVRRLRAIASAASAHAPRERAARMTPLSPVDPRV